MRFAALVVLASCPLALASCTSPPPLAEPAPLAAAPAASEPTVHAPEADPGEPPTEEQPAPVPTEFSPLWSQKPNGGWASATVITPSGDVASVSRGELTVHARHDGSVLESGPQCDPIGSRAMRRMGDKIQLACRDELRELSLPGMRYRIVQTGILGGKSSNFQEAAFGGDKVVYAHNDGTIEVYSTTSWQRLAVHQIPKMTFAPHVAVSADGSMFAISDGDADKVHLFRGPDCEDFQWLEEVMSFDDDGSHVFGSPGSFRSAEARIADGEMRDIVRVGSWLTDAVYFDHELAIAGSSGIVVKDLEGGLLQELSEMTAETLAVSADGNLICGADRGDEIACWGRGVIEPSTYRHTGQLGVH